MREMDALYALHTRINLQVSWAKAVKKKVDETKIYQKNAPL